MKITVKRLKVFGYYSYIKNSPAVSKILVQFLILKDED